MLTSLSARSQNEHFFSVAFAIQKLLVVKGTH
jgi:hypothetical protein